MVIGIYCRFSKQIDDIQSQSSLKHQLSNGKKFCEEMGYDYRVYSETVSGGIEMSDRNEGKKLIDDIENGIIDGVWVDKEDRLYRNFDESIIFKIILKKNQIKYFIGNSEIDFENDNDKIVNTVLSLLSDIEKKNINRRMSRGLKDRLLRGEHIGRIGYGFTKCKETNRILIDEEIKEKINKCYKYFIDKEWDNLRDWMFYCRKKIGVVKSTMWFYDLYRKTNYNGSQYIKYGGTEYKIKLPKMVNDNLYNQFCDKMRIQLSKGVSNNQKKDFTNIVRGKVYCGSCYHKLHILPNPTKNYRTLRCSFSGRRFTELYVGEKRNIPKHKTSFKYKFISNVIYNQLVEILLNSYTIKEEFKNRYMSQFDITEKRSEIKKWEKELNKLTDREVRLENSLIDGLISKENILKHKEKIQLERIRIEGFIMSIEDDINTHKESKKIMKWIDVFKNEYSKENMMKKSDRKKMEIINKYLDRVYVKGDSNIYEIDMRLKIPIINDKLRFDKKKYRKFIENGGDKKHYTKDFEVVKGEISKKDKICFNNSKFVLNLQPQWPMV